MYIAANSNKLLLQRGVILTENNTSTFTHNIAGYLFRDIVYDNYIIIQRCLLLLNERCKFDEAFLQNKVFQKPFILENVFVFDILPKVRQKNIMVIYPSSNTNIVQIIKC
jgi:hypothetical protein